MLDTQNLQLLETGEAFSALAHPVRRQLLGALRTPASATELGRDFALARQKVNYHLKALEAAGLITLYKERQRRNCTERVMVANASSLVMDPALLGPMGTTDPDTRDRFSWRYLIGAAARMIRDLAALRRLADKAGKRLATLTLESEIRFASADAQQAFAEEARAAVSAIAARYHDEAAPAGRRFRVLFAAYPKITREGDDT